MVSGTFDVLDSVFMYAVTSRLELFVKILQHFSHKSQISYKSSTNFSVRVHRRGAKDDGPVRTLAEHQNHRLQTPYTKMSLTSLRILVSGVFKKVVRT